MENPFWVGDGVCDGDSKEGYHVESCGWDGGDCAPIEFPDCIIYNPFTDENYNGESWLGDGYCDAKLNVEICEYDGGDCEEFNNK